MGKASNRPPLKPHHDGPRRSSPSLSLPPSLLTEQVGVKAPGTPTSTIFFPAKSSRAGTSCGPRRGEGIRREGRTAQRGEQGFAHVSVV